MADYPKPHFSFERDGVLSERLLEFNGTVAGTVPTATDTKNSFFFL